LLIGSSGGGAIITEAPLYKRWDNTVIPILLLLKRHFTTANNTLPLSKTALDICGYFLLHEMQGLLVEVLGFAFGVGIQYRPRRALNFMQTTN